MTSYLADHADALVAISDAGAAVTFTLTGQGTYNPATDTTTPGLDVTVDGAAVEVRGSLIGYQQLGLIATKSRTLLFVPTTYNTAPPLDSVVVWGGESYTVKNVQPIAPNGAVIAARVVVSL